MLNASDIAASEKCVKQNSNCHQTISAMQRPDALRSLRSIAPPCSELTHENRFAVALQIALFSLPLGGQHGGEVSGKMKDLRVFALVSGIYFDERHRL
jgi:hypothetical protein